MPTKIPIRTVYDAQNTPIGLAEFQPGEFIDISAGGTGGNTVATARVSLSVDDGNIRKLFSVTGSGSYDNATGIITVTGGVTSVGGATGTVSNVQLGSSITQSGILTTANVSEVNNLYFTNARTRQAISATGLINYSNCNQDSCCNKLEVKLVCYHNNLQTILVLILVRGVLPKTLQFYSNTFHHLQVYVCHQLDFQN